MASLLKTSVLCCVVGEKAKRMLGMLGQEQRIRCNTVVKPEVLGHVECYCMEFSLKHQERYREK